MVSHHSLHFLEQEFKIFFINFFRGPISQKKGNRAQLVLQGGMRLEPKLLILHNEIFFMSFNDYCADVQLQWLIFEFVEGLLNQIL